MEEAVAISRNITYVENHFVKIIAIDSLFWVGSVVHNNADFRKIFYLTKYVIYYICSILKKLLYICYPIKSYIRILSSKSSIKLRHKLPSSLTVNKADDPERVDPDVQCKKTTTKGQKKMTRVIITIVLI